MRVLGISMVLLSVVLGSGGVVLSSEVDPLAEMSLLPATPVDPPSRVHQQTCGLGEPTVRRIRLSHPDRQEGELAFTLNTRGYNYLAPGTYRPPVPVSDAVPASAAPETDAP